MLNRTVKLIIVLIFAVGPLRVIAQSPFKGFENLFTIPKGYVVNHVSTPPIIDGDINDAIWQQAKWTEDFVDIEGDLKPQPSLKTNVKMLWDDSCLYIAAQINDPHVWATLMHHDDIIFYDNDFEVFINPNNTTHQYFEIEYNALNTVFDLFLNKPYRNYGSPMINWDVEDLRSAVKVQGTLNNPTDTDKGWTLEMAIPFKAISLGNNIQVPMDGTLWRINFSRVEWDSKPGEGGKYVKLKDNTGRNLPEHNWVWSAQGVVNMHYPERWGYLQFSKINDNKTFELPYAELQKRYLWLVYYHQQAWLSHHHQYCKSLKKLGIMRRQAINNRGNNLQLEATAHQFMAFIADGNGGMAWSINQDGLIGKQNKN